MRRVQLLNESAIETMPYERTNAVRSVDYIIGGFWSTTVALSYCTRKLFY